MISRKDLDQVRHFAQNLRALVIGDVMLDKYIYGSVDRISPEAPVPIVNLHHTETKAGGAANVAINLSAWGCETGLIGLTGKDENAKSLSSILSDYQIRHQWIEDPGRPTTVKTRVVAASHHLLRIDEESSAYVSGDFEDQSLKEIIRFMDEFAPQLLILEDYNKGLLTARIIKGIIDHAKSKHIYVAVDPKDTHFFAYREADLFKPNLREASHAYHAPIDQSNIESVGEAWRTNHHIQTVAITLGAKGVFIQNGSGSRQVSPDRAIDVIDVCGAGDAVICALSLGLMSKLDLEKTASLANLAGAYVCSHSGVVAVNVDEIYQWI